MNPLGNNINGLPPQVKQNIQQMKQMMQTYKGQNPELIFRQLCQQRGIDADAFIRELRN